MRCGPEYEIPANVDINLGSTVANMPVEVTLDVATIGNNPLLVHIVQYNSSTQEDEVLATYEMPANRESSFKMEGVSLNNEPLRALLRSSGEGENSYKINQVRFAVKDVQVVPKLVSICNTDNFDTDYRFGFNGQEKDNEIKGIGNSLDLGARIYDSRLGKQLSVDPWASKYPWQTPYAYHRNSPIALIDWKGYGDPSTHTDKEGNVVAVIEDGDKGVYKHGDNADGNAPTEYQIKQRQKKFGTSANGEKMGETWTELGFSDFGAYEKDGTVTPGQNARIDFNSNFATEKMNEIVAGGPNFFIYMVNAKTGGDWDIKTQVAKGEGVYFGSNLYGKYASARDAGNMGAGLQASYNILIPNKVFDYGYGQYNKSGNSLIKTAKNTFIEGFMLATDYNTGKKMIQNTIYKGEDELSRQGIRAGKEDLFYFLLKKYQNENKK